MKRILGLDLGTASIGWAIVDREEENCVLISKGVDIFKEGVNRDKNKEEPIVKARTEARALRRHYFRRRLRKIELLKLLISYKLCPELTGDQLSSWRKKKEYPLSKEFFEWQRTDDNVGKNPYYDRYCALIRRLDLKIQSERYILGRALYHLVQRRGFLSNRKSESTNEDGKVNGGISDLSKEIRDAGCKYLGEYFYYCYRNNKKIRNHYTSRKQHYLEEFNAICDRQQLPDEWRKDLEQAIFFQRPLKSQKKLVGKCTFEKGKSRCPISHPRFEEFRMLSFLNNVRISVHDAEFRSLTADEIQRATSAFMRKSKPYFDFADVAKVIH